MAPNTPLLSLSSNDRQRLARELVEELLVQERERLHKWRALTNQPAQIDTGYVAQHLVSILVRVPGGGFRGKGDDLADGSEVKSANFLDSFDARGATSPRWNFTIKQLTELRKYLDAPRLFVASIDVPPGQAQAIAAFELQCFDSALEAGAVPDDLWDPLKAKFTILPLLFAAPATKRYATIITKSAEDNPCLFGDDNDENDVADRLLKAAEAVVNDTQSQRVRLTNACRVRIWEITPSRHDAFRDRFEEWIKIKAAPKFRGPSTKGKRQDANFQLFPPRYATDEIHARHGSARKGELPRLAIPLEDIPGAKRILHMTRDEGGTYSFA
jgi:hypothetical protein